MTILTHPIRFHGERSRWLVPSTSQPEVPNFVDMDEYGGIGFCSCEDFAFRKLPAIESGPIPGREDDYRCKHLKAVLQEIKMLKEWMRKT